MARRSTGCAELRTSGEVDLWHGDFPDIGDKLPPDVQQERGGSFSVPDGAGDKQKNVAKQMC